MTKQRTQISVDDAQRLLRDLEARYGAGVQITVDEDFNFELVDTTDLTEESPEESLKRAERQSDALREAELNRTTTAETKFTVPVETLAPKPAQVMKERTEPTKR